MPVDIIAAKTQTTQIVTPQTHFLITRCLNGRNVACIRSNEITVMFVREVRGNQKKTDSTILIPSTGNLTITVLHPMCVIIKSRFIVESPPTKMSTTVKFITKYMPRVRRLLFFMKRMIDRRFTVTIATATARNAANQVMHSDEKSIVDFSFRFPPLNSRPLSGSATYEKNSSKDCLVGKETLGLRCTQKNGFNGDTLKERSPQP